MLFLHGQKFQCSLFFHKKIHKNFYFFRNTSEEVRMYYKIDINRNHNWSVSLDFFYKSHFPQKKSKIGIPCNNKLKGFAG